MQKLKRLFLDIESPSEYKKSLRILKTFFLFASFFLLNASFKHACADEPIKNNYESPKNKEKPATADFSELVETGSGRIKEVINPMTLRLEDGRIISLTGLDFPDLDFYEPGPFAVTAQKILKDMLEDKEVLIYQTQNAKHGRFNRMGYHIAQLKIMNNNLWVQGIVLKLGLARMRTTYENAEMASQMLAAEKEARTQNLGIWEIDGYAVIPDSKADRNIGSYQIVEGKVVSASLRQNMLYLNFGQNWKKDFTIQISAINKRRFTSYGLDPQKLNGSMVRVRGWISSYNGPYIELDHPQALEVIDSPKDLLTKNRGLNVDKKNTETHENTADKNKEDVRIMEGSGLPDVSNIDEPAEPGYSNTKK